MVDTPMRGGRALPLLPPDAGEGGLDLLFEPGDQPAISGDQRLLGLDLGHNGLLNGESHLVDQPAVQL